MEEATGGTLPLLRLNPLEPLMYAWKIADRALAMDEKGQGVAMGIMGEPTGSGVSLQGYLSMAADEPGQPEWYTSRIALGLAYLAAESRLLQPFPQTAIAASAERHSESTQSVGSNPHLPAAQLALESHLDRYTQIKRSLENSEKGAGDFMGTLEFIGRGALGLLRSRGL